MLTHPTVDKLHQLRCTGMAKAMAEQLASPQVQNLSFEERLGLLVDRELTERHSRQLTNRLRRARLRHDACIEDIDFRQPRGLDKDLVLSLADGRWVREHLGILITGPAGVGKSWITIQAVIAWRVMLMTLLAREVPQCDAELMFTDMELRFLADYAADATLPAPCDLAGAVRLVAILGGYQNRKHDPPPGHQLMWRGYERMSSATLGYRIAQRQLSGPDST